MFALEANRTVELTVEGRILLG